MRGQVGARAVGIMLGLETTLNPFMFSPAYIDIAGLPLPERVARMRQPEVRQAILDGAHVEDRQLGSRVIAWFPHMFRLGDPPNYEPDPSESAQAESDRSGRPPGEIAYDWLLENDGKALLYVPSLNWAHGNLDAVGEMLVHTAAVPGLSDGGAHVGTICDVSFPTTLLQWWGRDRPHGRIPVETLIAKQCRMTAETVGLGDRGVLAAGYRADINVIDFDNLRLHVPDIAYDLPAGGRADAATSDRIPPHVRRRHRDHGRRGIHGCHARPTGARRPMSFDFPVISADSHITEPPDCYIAHIDPAFRDRAPHMASDDVRGDVFVIPGMGRPIAMGLVAAAGKPADEITIAGVKFEDLHRSRLGLDPPARRSGPRRRLGRGHLSDRRDDDLQPRRHRLQEGLLRRLQPLDRRLLLGGSAPPARLRPDGAALGRGGHRRPGRDQGGRPARRDDARRTGNPDR